MENENLYPVTTKELADIVNQILSLNKDIS